MSDPDRTGFHATSAKSFQVDVNDGGANEVGLEGGWLGVRRGLRDVFDDKHMNALFDQEAKQYQPEVREKRR